MQFLAKLFRPLVTQVEGIDVSAYQGSINWSLVKAAGKRFAFIKATEGRDLVDKAFRTNWNVAKTVGIVCGAYHYFRPKEDVAAQVDNFCNAVGELAATDLAAVLDVENPADWQQVPVTQRVDRIMQWLDAVSARLGHPCIVYASTSFVSDVLGGDARLLKYGLWLADWTSAPAPRVPKPWSSWTFWQNSDTGRVDGIAGDVDLDRFNGSVLSFHVMRLSRVALPRLFGFYRR